MDLAHAPAAINASADPAHLAKLYFAVDATTPSDAEAALGLVLATLQANPGSKARVSGYHDATGSVEVNQELSKQRAKAVQAALVALGVAEDKVELKKPEQMQADGSNAEARRVEVILAD